MGKIIRVLNIMMLGFMIFAPQTARAQGPLEPTQLVVGAPTNGILGQALTVQAVLADSRGHPISEEVIYFTAEATFLGKKSDVILAQAITNGNGQAVAQFVNDSSGLVTVRGEFLGDNDYAPSNATTQITIAGTGQVFSEHIGVDIPGFNVPPMSAPVASIQSLPQQSILRFIQNLWPAMNGWPVAAVLFLVWSMYLITVKFVFRIAALGSKSEESPSFSRRLP